ncbi:hypothetical protein C7410_14740 [Paraburkholderia silvatlantica]|uniref:Uncharacterized protein n=1 Tax=Paraburkholderia silvatlantica TaxID=321895 RepID=A0A2V4THZ0_9BURK|nr:hypothetical protein [Paraburkholderia silvatlantica]PYE13385.1 hypothetical protein C7410_14740 [Paraburkholderia silvatlantica]
MKYRPQMNGSDYLIFEGCYQLALWIVGIAGGFALLVVVMNLYL